MTPDTTALRAQAAGYRGIGPESPTDAAYIAACSPATVRALCDGYDEAQRLRGTVAVLEGLHRQASREKAEARAEAQRLRDESLRHAVCCRTAELHAALVADLRALCDRYEHADERFNPPTGQQVAARFSAVIDRHAPGTTGGAG